MAKLLGLKCRECGATVPTGPSHVCDECFGPLEVLMDWDAIRGAVTRDSIRNGPTSMWRYADLLPVEGEPAVGHNTGWTPLIRARRLGRELGLDNLYIKNDSVNHPTLSFKDRVVATAITQAKAFGYDTVACASTGNLANSVAAQAAEAGMEAWVFIPDDLEAGKVVNTQVYAPNLVTISGNYDEVNRLCAEAGDRYRWAFVNIGLRPYYGDGSKSMGYEIAEQLGWRAPDAVVCPCAGGSLIGKIRKAIGELDMLGLLDGPAETRMYAAQGEGCSPITTAVKNGWDAFKPQRPNTIARSIAIGNPADGLSAIEIVRTTGGWAEDATDDEVRAGISLLARTEGIFTETAGGVTVAAAAKLARQGRFRRDETVVLAITGNGLKTLEAVAPPAIAPLHIPPTLAALEAALQERRNAA